MHAAFDEFPTQASIEFSELVNNVHLIEESKEPIFSALFLDKKPLWRALRYRLLLKNLKHSIEQESLLFLSIQEKNTLYKKTSALLKLLNSYKEKEDRKVYLTFIKAYRCLLKGSEYQQNSSPRSNKMLQHIAKAFFTEVDHHLFCNKLTEIMKRAGSFQLKLLNKSEYDQDARFLQWDWFLRSPSKNSEGFQHISEDTKHFYNDLLSARASIEHAPHALRIPFFAMLWQFMQGQLNLHYDPYTQENTPYKLFETSNKIPIIRMGTPTIETIFAPFTKSAAITNEFLAFLDAYKAMNKCHLYINLQNRNEAHFGRNEAPRCKAIEALSVQYPGTIIVLTLAKNTAFYHQEEQFTDIDNAQLFKTELLNQTKSTDGGFYFGDLPEELTSDKFFLSHIDYVHTTFFADKALLKRNERLDFIELFYLELEKCYLNSLAIASCNISCKDGIDRAGGANALLYLDLLPKTKENLNYLQSVLFAPALLVKKRAITKGRFDRFITTAMRLISKENS
ncbi:MAG: hypothetical protein P4L16_02095 [Chlamydiales bacterium]|nr:hypothetical protein [Chlamydiales bacterium]